MVCLPLVYHKTSSSSGLVNLMTLSVWNWSCHMAHMIWAISYRTMPYGFDRFKCKVILVRNHKWNQMKCISDCKIDCKICITRVLFWLIWILKVSKPPEVPNLLGRVSWNIEFYFEKSKLYEIGKSQFQKFRSWIVVTMKLSNSRIFQLHVRLSSQKFEFILW